jgi:hypothetical protein
MLKMSAVCQSILLTASTELVISSTETTRFMSYSAPSLDSDCMTNFKASNLHYFYHNGISVMTLTNIACVPP